MSDSTDDATLVKRVRDRLSLLPISVYSVEQCKARDAEVAALDRVILCRDRIKSVVHYEVKRFLEIECNWNAGWTSVRADDSDRIAGNISARCIQELGL